MPIAKASKDKKELSPKQREELLGALRARFEKNMNCHKGLAAPAWLGKRISTELDAKTVPFSIIFQFQVV